MKPIELKIKGLSSFEEEQRIDFTRLTKEGIFGIFGSTGSGKSTIIDAIIMALYDKIPRYDEKGANSNFINVNSKTTTLYFKFSLGNDKVYALRRAYEKLESGYKTTEAKLYDVSSEKPIILTERIKEVNKTVEQLIGLSYNDFIRAVIIPQGKFSEFLLLENRARRLMLERVFRLEEYGKDLTKKVKMKYDIVNGEMNILRQKLEIYKDVSDEVLDREKLIYQEKSRDLDTKKQELLEKNKVYNEYKQIQQLLIEYNNFLLKESELLKKSAEMDELGIHINKAMAAHRAELVVKSEIELNKKIIQLDKRLVDIITIIKSERSKLDKLEIDYEKATYEKDHIYPEILKKEANFVQALKLMDELIPLQKERDNLKEIFITKRALSGSLSKKLEELNVSLEIDEKRLLELSEQVKLLLINESSNEQKELEVIQQQLEDRINFLKNNNIVSVIAETLSYNKPCPVCGSKDHPNPAKKLADDLLEQANNDLKKNKDDQQKLKKNLQNQKLMLLENQKVFDERVATKKKEKEKISIELNDIEAHKIKIQTSGMEKREMIEKLKKQIRELVNDARDNTKEFLTAELSKIRNRINIIVNQENILRKNLDDCKLRIQALQTENKEIEEQLKAFIELNKNNEMQIKTIIDEENLGNKDTLLKYLSYDIKKNQQRLLDYKENLKTIQDNIIRLKPKLKDIDNINNVTESLGKEVVDLQMSVEDTTKEVAISSSKIEQMTQDLDIVKRLRKEYIEIEKKESILKDLSSLLAGNTFVEFVAKKQLFYITSETSKRLKEMTNGKYTLELDETDFVIKDNFNGGIQRNPRTLSGGEIFIVSFCLALALSSKIQLKSNTPLELFFLDEGFGTLDKILVETVMDTLEKLKMSDMAIGVITHVEELKSRIPLRIDVISAKQGLNGTIVYQS